MAHENAVQRPFETSLIMNLYIHALTVRNLIALNYPGLYSERPIKSIGWLCARFFAHCSEAKEASIAKAKGQ